MKFPESYSPKDEKIWHRMPLNQNRLRDFPHLQEEVFINDYGLPVGRSVECWRIPTPIPKDKIIGKSCVIEELNQTHAGHLLNAFSADVNGKMWTYQSYGPFNDLATLECWIESANKDGIMFVIKDLESGRYIGTSGLISINPGFGSIQLGHLNFADPGCQAATEAIALLMKMVFELG